MARNDADGASAVHLKLAGRWRLLPLYPIGVMILISAFVLWLTRDGAPWWLAPMVLGLPSILALIIARDIAAIRLRFDADGLIYRGVGYALQAPWDRVRWGRDGHGEALLVEDPMVSMNGWFGTLFPVARMLAPVHGQRAAAAMRSVPIVCFDRAAVARALAGKVPLTST